MSLLLAVIFGSPLFISMFVIYDVLKRNFCTGYDHENMRRLLATQENPPIPERVQDIVASRPWPRKSEMEIGLGDQLEETDSAKWGDKEEATARACRETTVTPENQALLASYHPTLSKGYVFAVRELTGNMIWTLHGVKYQLPHTHAAGREIHVMDSHHRGSGMAPCDTRPVPIQRIVYPRRMLSPEAIATIRTCFPVAIGVRIYISGFAVFLFHNTSDLRASSAGARLNYVGGLNMGYDIMNIRPSSMTARSGQKIVDSRPISGLKIRLQDGLEAVTTTTHSHVRKPLNSEFVQQLADCWYAGKDSILRNIPMKSNESVPGGPKPRKSSWANSSLHKCVHITEQAHQTGTIAVTYDEPSPIFAYPTGYRHDLSLVTGSSLPNVSGPPGVGKITGWADYDEALDGKPAFVMRLDGASDDAIKPAIVEGTTYLWDAQGRVSASLFWRTTDDFDNVSENSGAVLCLGKPEDKEVRAVVFQNYEAPMRDWEDRHTMSKLVNRHECMKGGFILPQEVRESKILSDGELEKVEKFSTN